MLDKIKNLLKLNKQKKETENDEFLEYPVEHLYIGTSRQYMEAIDGLNVEYERRDCFLVKDPKALGPWTVKKITGVSENDLGVVEFVFGLNSTIYSADIGNGVFVNKFAINRNQSLLKDSAMDLFLEFLGPNKMSEEYLKLRDIELTIAKLNYGSRTKAYREASKLAKDKQIIETEFGADE